MRKAGCPFCVAVHLEEVVGGRFCRYKRSKSKISGKDQKSLIEGVIDVMLFLFYKI